MLLLQQYPPMKPFRLPVLSGIYDWLSSGGIIPDLSGPPGPVAVPPTPPGELPSLPVVPSSTEGQEISALTGRPVRRPTPKPPSPSQATRPPAGPSGPSGPPPPPFTPPPPASDTPTEAPGEMGGPLASEIRGGRFVPLDAPGLSEFKPGQAPDFSQRWAELARAAGNRGPWWAQILAGLSAGINPQGHALIEADRNRRIEMAEKGLLMEQSLANKQFERQEDLKEKVYLSQLAPTIGKSYVKDIKTGVEGYVTPMEMSTMARQDEQMDIAQQNLDRQLKALEQQGGYYAAVAENLRAQAGKANKAEELALLSNYIDLLQTQIQAAGPLADEALTARARQATEALGGRLGLGAPAGAAPAAAPAGPLEQQGLKMGLPPELAKGLDRLDTPAKRSAAFEKLKKDPKYNQYLNVLGQLLGGQ